MIALFFGSRGWTDDETIRADLLTLDPKTTIIVEGGARGADRIARVEAHKLGFHVATVEALWQRSGLGSPGPNRNAAMKLLRPDAAYCYSLGTPGSRDMCRRLMGEVVIHVRAPR